MRKRQDKSRHDKILFFGIFISYLSGCVSYLPTLSAHPFDGWNDGISSRFLSFQLRGSRCRIWSHAVYYPVGPPPPPPPSSSSSRPCFCLVSVSPSVSTYVSLSLLSSPPFDPSFAKSGIIHWKNLLWQHVLALCIFFIFFATESEWSHTLTFCNVVLCSYGSVLAADTGTGTVFVEVLSLFFNLFCLRSYF